MGKLSTYVANARRYDPLVMVRIDADQILIVGRDATQRQFLQFILIDVRPTPYSSVDDGRHALPARHLSRKVFFFQQLTRFSRKASYLQAAV